MHSIVLRMETVAHIKFIGKNITRSGNRVVESLPDVRPKPALHRSVTYNESA